MPYMYLPLRRISEIFWTILPTTEVIKLTKECSEAILNTSPVKKKDPGCPTIDCSIRCQNFENALYDLGASVSVMPKKVFDKLNYSTLMPASMCLQLADQSVRYPAGIAENIPIKIQNFFVLVDFVVLTCRKTWRHPHSWETLPEHYKCSHWCWSRRN